MKIQNTFKILESDEADEDKEEKEEERGGPCGQKDAISWPKICGGEKRQSKMKMSKAPRFNKQTKRVKLEKKSATGSSNCVEHNLKNKGECLIFFAKSCNSIKQNLKKV